MPNVRITKNSVNITKVSVIAKILILFFLTFERFLILLLGLNLLLKIIFENIRQNDIPNIK